MKPAFLLLVLLACVACDDTRSTESPSQTTAAASQCQFLSPGNLEPNSGEGVADRRIWAPDIISPFGDTNAIAKSQVYLPGGSQAVSDDQCVIQNFRYPHRDTFCETRGTIRDSLNCPRRTIHQGIDINAGDRQQCLQMLQARRDINMGASADTANIIPVLAVSDGVISYIGQYTVDLRPAEGAISRFRYLHLNMQTLNVAFGDAVKQGDILGYYYNDFAGTPTTFHLHFEVIAFVDGEAQYVSPYMSFVKAEERSKGIVCTDIG